MMWDNQKHIKRKLTKPLITLVLQNNTDDILPVSIMAGYNPLDISNQATVYNWSLAGAVYANPVTITFWPVSNPLAYQTLSVNINSLSAQGLVAALNSLSVAGFFLSSNGQTLYAANDTVVFGDLNLGTAQSVISWNNSSGDSSMQIDANAVTIINSFAPPQSGMVNVNNGASVDGTYVFGAAVPFTTILIQRTLKVPPFTTSLVYTDVGSSVGGIIPPFIVDTNYNYSITLTTP